MINDVALELKDVSIAFGDDLILDSISMNIPRGKLVTITGPSGCGKSTLLKIAAGLIPPDSGTVLIGGVNISNISRSVLFQMRKNFAFVFQDAALISNLNVFNNVALPLRYHHTLKEEEVENRVNEALKNFDLEDEKLLLPAQLSMGEKKLVSFARGLIIEPKLIFFDEPVSGIDAVALNKMVEKIIPLRDDPEITVIMVSHNLDFIKSYADYVALIYNSKLYAYGKRDEILKSTDPTINKILSIIIDEQAIVAEEVLGILTGNF